MSKRKNRKDANVRQKLAAAKIVGNIGKPIGKLMQEAGYSKAYSKNPNQLLKTAGWQDLMEKYFPDLFLARKHKKLLNKKEFIAIGKAGEREVLKTGEIDPDAVARGLDMAYKLKSKYPAQKHKVEGLVEVVEIIKYGRRKD